MANAYTIMIDGEQVKEMRCKNDSCRALFGYENIKLGIIIFTCPACGEISKFHVGYKHAKKDFFDKLEKQFVKGGEKKNG